MDNLEIRAVVFAANVEYVADSKDPRIQNRVTEKYTDITLRIKQGFNFEDSKETRALIRQLKFAAELNEMKT